MSAEPRRANLDKETQPGVSFPGRWLAGRTMQLDLDRLDLANVDNAARVFLPAPSHPDIVDQTGALGERSRSIFEWLML